MPCGEHERHFKDLKKLSTKRLSRGWMSDRTTTWMPGVPAAACGRSMRGRWVHPLLIAVSLFAMGKGAVRPSIAQAQVAAPLQAAAASGGLGLPGSPQKTAEVVGNYGRLPLSFNANQGQVDGPVRFLSMGQGYQLYFTPKEVELTLSKPAARAGGKVDVLRTKDGRLPKVSRNSADRGNEKNQAGMRGSAEIESYTLSMALGGANPDAQVSGVDALPGRANYFLGNDPARWRADVPSYAKVQYRGVYPGVDLVYYGNQRHLEYDFVVAPGASGKPIRVQFGGAGKLKLKASGDLIVTAGSGEVVFRKPSMYQVESGVRQPVAGRFELLGKTTVGFAIERYNHDEPLVIDPELAYSTYLGGSGTDDGQGIAVDAAGSAYVTGSSSSTDFPVVADAAQPGMASSGNQVAYVTKFSADGQTLVYSTYLGGSGGDHGNSIAVDAAGNAYIVGYTYSTDFPVTAGAYQAANAASANGLSNVFAAKLNATGSALLYATYLGGSGNLSAGDFGEGIAVDTAGDAYLTGYTYSSNFPLSATPYQATNKSTANNGQAVFVTKLNPAGSGLVFSTYLGGSGAATGNPNLGAGDLGEAIAVDSAGDVYIAGTSTSSDFPTTTGAFQTVNNTTLNQLLCYNGFVAKMNPAGTALAYSTYIGGSGTIAPSGTEYCDGAYALAIDATGNAYITGNTGSSDYPLTPGALQTTNNEIGSGYFTGIVTKVNPTGSALMYSTLLGGAGGQELGHGIAVDAAGNALLDGTTTSASFPVTAGAYQTSNGDTAAGKDSVFLSRLNAGGTALLYSTYLGGSGGENGNGLATDAAGSAYLVGDTSSTDFPLVAAFQSTNKSTGVTAFVAKLALLDASTTTLASSLNPAVVGQTVTFTAVVAAATGTVAPTGNATFSIDGAATIVALDSTGHAALSTSSLSVGPHAITVAYSGDTTFAGSGATLAETISASAGTATTLSVSPASPVAAGTAVTLTADVTAAGVPVSPGLVTFCDASAASCENAAVLGTGQLTASGTATLRFVPGIGTHSYAAVFNGTVAAAGSTSTAQPLIVTGLYPTTATITATGAPGNYTLTGTVTGPSSANLTPTGNVSFLDATNGNASLGSAALGAGVEALSFNVVAAPATGKAPFSAAVGDWNGDGKADFAVTNQTDNTVTVLLGNGDGTFTAAASVATGLQPIAIVTADFNGDGKPDLAVSNGGDNTITVLMGNGDGTFTAVAGGPAIGPGPQAMVTGDFNGDGRADVAIVSYFTNAVTVLLGNGDGTFTAAASPVTGTKPVSITLGDYNRDGNQDLAVANQTGNSITVLLGNGDGTFTAAASPVTGNEPESIATGDVNLDGKADLVVSNYVDGTATVLLGNGDGTFAAVAATPALGANPYSLTLSDINNDGKPDIVAVNNAANTVTALLGNGDGSFTAAPAPPGTGTSPTFVLSADLNGDGTPDIASVNDGSNNLTVVLVSHTQTASATLASVAVAGAAGTHNVAAQYGGDTNFSSSTSATTPLATALLTPVIRGSIAGGSSVPYGPLPVIVTVSGSGTAPPVATGSIFYVLDGGAVTAVPGTLSGGAITFALPQIAVGSHSIGFAYSGDSHYAGTPGDTPPASTFTPFTVVPATLTVTATSLTGVSGEPLPALTDTITGFVYSDTAATAVTGAAVLSTTATTASAPGTYAIAATKGTLAAANYNFTFVAGTLTLKAPASTAVSLTSIAPTLSAAGSGSTTITATGTNFTPTSMVTFNGTRLATRFVSATQLTAVVPAALLATAGTSSIEVTDSSSASVSLPQTFTILPTIALTFTGPSTTNPGDQPTVTFGLQQAYPVALTGTVTLAFTPLSGSGSNPQVQFSNGGTSLSVPIAANSTATPVVLLQVGNVAGTITVTLRLTAAGVDVTPPGLAPITIVVAPTVPAILTQSLSSSGSTLTVVITGYSTTREVQQATFTFTAASGTSLAEKSVTVPVTSLFQTWYSNADSAPYGSSFTYTQTFTISGSAAGIASLGVTLTNAQGTSAVVTAQ